MWEVDLPHSFLGLLWCVQVSPSDFQNFLQCNFKSEATFAYMHSVPIEGQKWRQNTCWKITECTLYSKYFCSIQCEAVGELSAQGCRPPDGAWSTPRIIYSFIPCLFLQKGTQSSLHNSPLNLIQWNTTTCHYKVCCSGANKTGKGKKSINI